MMNVKEIISSTIFLAASMALLSGGVLGQMTSNDKPAARKGTERGSNEAAPAATPLPAPTVAKTEQGDDDDVAENEILPYYNNYLREYRLGPSDMISVEVFGQCPDYCKTGITIPPNARISYPLIREGIMVAGKTVEQIAEEITLKLDEFIIDPKVTVTLDKAMSTRYSVMGKVENPGVRVMERKVSVYEAILEAGGVTREGDRKKAVIVSYTPDGRLAKKVVSLADMEAGKAEMVFLNPGDQVFVPGKGFSIDKVFDIIGKASVVRFLFGSPF